MREDDMDPTAHELDELEVVRAYDAYIEAVAGRGHEGPHDRDICPGGHDESHGEREDCSACGGAQYGTEDELRQAIDGLRSAARLQGDPGLLRALADELERNPSVLVSRDAVVANLRARALAASPAEPSNPGLLDRLERFSYRAETNGKVDANQLRKAIAVLRNDALAALASPAEPEVRPADGEGLREAAQAIVDQWLATFGPDGYPHKMPENLRLLRAALAASPAEPDRRAEVEAALAEVGLPLTASVAGLIRHHRNNEAATNGAWKIVADALQEKLDAANLLAAARPADEEGLRRALERGHLMWVHTRDCAWALRGEPCNCGLAIEMHAALACDCGLDIEVAARADNREDDREAWRRDVPGPPDPPRRNYPEPMG